MKWLMSVGVVIGILLPACAPAQSVEVKEAWIRGTVPAQQASGAFMDITSKTAARLVGVASPVAANVEIHNMTLEKGVMRMFPVAGIDLPAGRTVKLAPGGYHVMLMDLRRTLKAGERVSLQLTFELADKKRETLEVSVEVRDLKGQPAHRH